MSLLIKIWHFFSLVLNLKLLYNQNFTALTLIQSFQLLRSSGKAYGNVWVEQVDQMWKFVAILTIYGGVWQIFFSKNINFLDNRI